MRPPLPPRYDSVVALYQRVELRTPEGVGTAIATAFDGDAMIYLVVLHQGGAAPRWVREEDVTGASVG
jgi:hypothetical protein